MKTIKNISLVLVLFLLIGCEQEKFEFGELIVPTNIEVTETIIGQDINNPDLAYGDGSGLVNFVVTADNAISYSFNFGDGSSDVSLTGEITHLFTKVGVNTYDVVVKANGTGGVTSSTTLQVEVYSVYEDQDAKDILSGGLSTSKTWYWAADQIGHIGLGPKEYQNDNTHTWPSYWSNPEPFWGDKLCMYDAEFVFTQDDVGNLTMQQTVGEAYVPGSYADILGIDGDTCHGSEIATSLGLLSNVAVIASSSIATSDGVDPVYRGTTLQFSDDGFMSWYVASNVFEIITLTDTELYVRIEGPEFAWYCKFQTTDPNASSESFDTLVWSDEFNEEGAINTANWLAETTPPNNGSWWNDEEQHYTDRLDNVYVSDGTLKIVAKKEEYTYGSSIKEYTSARIMSKDLNEFTYGKIEVRAKLPDAQGTWPAIWMLGANDDVVGWPACGEIDIMEQTGWDKTKTSAALHFTDNSGGDGPTGDTDNETSTTEFHDYAVEWTETSIKFSVDGEYFYSYTNDSSLPFNNDFYLILNVAMGGTLGGTIDASFSESIMEIDYVRVYQ